MVFKWKPDVNIEGKVPGISKFRVGCRQLSLGWSFCHSCNFKKMEKLAKTLICKNLIYTFASGK